MVKPETHSCHEEGGELVLPPEKDKQVHRLNGGRLGDTSGDISGSTMHNICKENGLFKVLNTITRMNLIDISRCLLQA